MAKSKTSWWRRLLGLGPKQETAPPAPPPAPPSEPEPFPSGPVVAAPPEPEQPQAAPEPEPEPQTAAPEPEPQDATPALESPPCAVNVTYVPSGGENREWSHGLVGNVKVSDICTLSGVRADAHHLALDGAPTNPDYELLHEPGKTYQLVVTERVEGS